MSEFIETLKQQYTKLKPKCCVIMALFFAVAVIGTGLYINY